jgi:hypothetical protein
MDLRMHTKPLQYHYEELFLHRYFDIRASIRIRTLGLTRHLMVVPFLSQLESSLPAEYAHFMLVHTLM